MGTILALAKLFLVFSVWEELNEPLFEKDPFVTMSCLRQQDRNLQLIGRSSMVSLGTSQGASSGFLPSCEGHF